MSNDATYRYAEGRLADGLLVAADAALGMGYGNRKDSDAALHARFIGAVRTAENAARIIAHDRGLRGQGIAWVRLAGRLGTMLKASTRSAQLSAANTLSHDPREGRGLLWIRLGTILKAMADDCAKASQQKSAAELVVGGREYRN